MNPFSRGASAGGHTNFKRITVPSEHANRMTIKNDAHVSPDLKIPIINDDDEFKRNPTQSVVDQ